MGYAVIYGYLWMTVRSQVGHIQPGEVELLLLTVKKKM